MQANDVLRALGGFGNVGDGNGGGVGGENRLFMAVFFGVFEHLMLEV